jgi:hypothetical protein
LHKRYIVYTLLSFNKDITKHKKRGRLLIHIPGAWSYPSKKQVTPTHSVNVCMFYLEILCDQALECSVNSKRYILPSKVAPRRRYGLRQADERGATLITIRALAVFKCKDTKNYWNEQEKGKNLFRNLPM